MFVLYLKLPMFNVGNCLSNRISQVILILDSKNLITTATKKCVPKIRYSLSKVKLDTDVPIGVIFGIPPYSFIKNSRKYTEKPQPCGKSSE